MKIFLLLLLPLGLLLSSCSREARSTGEADSPQVEKRNLRLVSMLNTSVPISGEQIVWITDDIREMSGGSLNFKVFSSGELVGVLEVLDAVSSGKVQAGYSSSGWWMGKIPAAPLFCTFPFGPATNEYLSWFFYGNGMDLYQEMYDTHGYNVKVILCGMIPPETSGWFANEIQDLEELKGLKMRFYGLGGEVMKKFGVAVRLLPPSEIFPALEKGVIDATEFSQPSADEKMGFYKIAKYNYFPGWHQQASAYELLVNKDVWNTFSSSQQSIIENAARSNIIRSIAIGEGSQSGVIKRNIDRGVVNVSWSPEAIEEFRKAWLEVIEERVEEDAFFKKAWQDLEQFRSDYKEWGSRAYLR